MLAALLWGAVALAQAPEATATWKVAHKAVSDNEYELTFTATIEPGWHIYTTDHKYNPTTLEFDEPVAWTLDGEYGGETSKADIININKPVRIMVPGQE